MVGYNAMQYYVCYHSLFKMSVPWEANAVIMTNEAIQGVIIPGYLDISVMSLAMEFRTCLRVCQEEARAAISTGV